MFLSQTWTEVYVAACGDCHGKSCNNMVEAIYEIMNNEELHRNIFDLFNYPLVKLFLNIFHN